MTSVHFGALIKDLVDSSGETKVESAKRLGYSKNNLFDIFKKEDVGTDVLKKVAAAYRVDIGYFFADSIRQKGTNNAIGGAVSQYYNNTEESRVRILTTENDGLKAENKALREQIETLKELVQVLKERGK